MAWGFAGGGWGIAGTLVVMTQTPRAQAVIDLAALRANVAAMRAKTTSAHFMMVVKADAYGHGLVPCSRAALEAGADWLGTALLSEAVDLRSQGVGGNILAWLYAPGEPQLEQAIAADIDLAAYAPWAIAELADAGRRAGKRPRVHLKVDTGMARGGAAFPVAFGASADQDGSGEGMPAAGHPGESAWELLVQAAAKAQQDNAIEVVGIFSHLVSSEVPGGRTTAQQLQRFTSAVEQARQAGLDPAICHLANSGAILTTPQTHLDMVRPGITCYGLLPDPDLGTPQEHGLKPVMTLTAQVALSKHVAAEQGVSYGHTYRTAAATNLCLVPLGYADGLPRAGSNRAQMWLGGQRHRIAGRVCMDQIVLDTGDYAARPGEQVVVFGPGLDGEPTATDWARWCDAIAYEFTPSIGPRVQRTYLD